MQKVITRSIYLLLILFLGSIVFLSFKSDVFACSEGCVPKYDAFGGYWCECPVAPGQFERDLNPFPCGGPPCEFGPVGCYCCNPGVNCGGPTDGGGGGGSYDCGPYPCAPSGGGGGGGGCNPNNWGSWSACNNSACGTGVRSRQNQCGTYQTQSCCNECGPQYGSWSACTGSPAIKSRLVSYNCQSSTWETASCTGSIQARAVVVNTSNTLCPTVRASTTGITGTVHQFTPASASQPAPQTQSGASYVTFANVVGGSYTISPTAPSDYVLAKACWTKALNSFPSGTGMNEWLSVPTDGDTLTWDLGYTLGTPWVQTGGGGNVYAAGFLKSFIPSSASPRVFALDSSGGSPGVVLHGTDFPTPGYDLDSDVMLKGESLVSSANWLAQEAESQTTKTNWYEWMRIKLGGPTQSENSLFPYLGEVSKPASRPTPYYVVGDMTTFGDWVVGEGETVIFIVNGNLTLDGKVNITGSGFAAFIVNGNITVSSSMGGPYTSSTPVIEGIYVTSPTGTFQTGTSSVPGKERLVAQGMFVAGSFLLQRDLDSVGANTTTSSELFLYNPRLLFSMPDSLRDVRITWEEVAP